MVALAVCQTHACVGSMLGLRDGGFGSSLDPYKPRLSA